LEPVTVTELPARPLVGVKEAMTGTGGKVTMKEEALEAVPPGVVTVTGPLEDPAGMTKLI
jgi:hypothetical protein